MWPFDWLSLDPFTFPNIYLIGLGLTSIAFLALTALSWLTPWIKRRRADLRRTETIFDPSSTSQERFHTLLKDESNVRPAYTPSEIYLSIIVPAMNEEERLPIMLDECLEYCNSRRTKESEFTFEIIVVDDGSKDKTAFIGAEYGIRNHGDVKVLKLDANRGKGGAVRVGILHARGKLILFVDADGATKFSDIERLEEQMVRSCGSEVSGKPFPTLVDESFPAVVIGSRAHMEEESRASRSLSRTILMHGFHLIVWIFAVRTIRDTQCGFKLFTRSSAARLFSVLHIERWAFDVELLYLAEKWKMHIDEVPVTWHEVDGSKITPIWSWLQMGRDLVLIWFRYTVGIWNDQIPRE